MALTPPEVAQITQAVKSLLEIWLKVKLVFQTAFRKGEIQREQENAFLQLKSDLSRNLRVTSDRLPKDLQFDGEVMMEMMKNAISMQHLQNLSVNDKRTIFNQWHRVYIKLTRTYGAVEVIDQGYYPSLHRDLLRTAKPKPKGKAGAQPPPRKPAGGH